MLIIDNKGFSLVKPASYGNAFLGLATSYEQRNRQQTKKVFSAKIARQ